jgi:transposase, IS30 family
MAHSYKHLTHEEREKLVILKAQGLSLRKIAKALSRSHSSLSRELRRNAPLVRHGYYLPHKAQNRAAARKSKAHQRPRLKNASIRRYVFRKIQAGLSPELIAGRINRTFSSNRVSHEAIYQYLYLEAPDLVSFLPRAHRKRLKRWHSKKHAKSHIPQRVPITQRPEIIARRTQFGHWEADTVISRKSLPSLLVLAERKSRLVKISWLPRKSASSARKAINRRLAQLPKTSRRSITYDNGSENVEHIKVNRTLGTKSYFCLPFHSWEKGTVENIIGLVRRTFPKKTDFATITTQQVKSLENRLNRRPRKCLRFQTPLEVYKKSGALTG